MRSKQSHTHLTNKKYGYHCISYLINRFLSLPHDIAKTLRTKIWIVPADARAVFIVVLALCVAKKAKFRLSGTRIVRGERMKKRRTCEEELVLLKLGHSQASFIQYGISQLIHEPQVFNAARKGQNAWGHMYSYMQYSNLCKANLYKATQDYMTGTLYKLLYTSVDPLELPMLAVVGD